MPEKLVVYALNGSEYVSATLTGLQSRGIKHAIKYVAIDRKKRTLPSGGFKVPEITYEHPEKNIEPTIVPDSARIFEWLDETYGFDEAHQFCADKSDEYKALQLRASVEFDAYVIFYGWVFNPTFKTTLRTRVHKYLPMQSVIGPNGWLKGLGQSLIMTATGKIRKDCKITVNNVMEVVPKDSKPAAVHKAINDKLEPQVYERLVALLRDALGPYVVGRQQKNPDNFIQSLNSVECYTFAMLSRFVGTLGDTNFPPSLPERLPKEEGLGDLMAWFNAIQNAIPLQWNNMSERKVYPTAEEAAEDAAKAEEEAAAAKDAAEPEEQAEGGGGAKKDGEEEEEGEAADAAPAAADGTAEETAAAEGEAKPQEEQAE